MKTKAPLCPCGCGKPVKRNTRSPYTWRKYRLGHNSSLYRKTLKKGVKRCSRCNKKKPLKAFHKSKASKDGLAVKCKVCSAKLFKKWHLKNGSSKQYKKANRERALKYRKDNLFKVRKKDRTRSKLHINTLDDTYVKRILHETMKYQGLPLKFEDIPTELVAAKREHIKLGRLLRGL